MKFQENCNTYLEHYRDCFQSEQAFANTLSELLEEKKEIDLLKSCFEQVNDQLFPTFVSAWDEVNCFYDKIVYTFVI